MPYTSHLFLRVEPAMPIAIAAAARARGIGASEFIRRAVIQALDGGVFRVENRKRRRPSGRKSGALRLAASAPDRDPPPPAAPAAARQPVPHQVAA